MRDPVRETFYVRFSSRSDDSSRDDKSSMSANDPKRTFDLHSSAAAEGNLTRIRVVEAPQRAEDIFEFVGLFPSGAQHLHHPLQ